MKLKDYIIALQEVAETYPNAEVVYSIDDEGNGFNKVHCSPSLGNYTAGDFIHDDGTTEFHDDYGVNAICVN